MKMTLTDYNELTHYIIGHVKHAHKISAQLNI
jgi:hypothetical protein